MEEGDLTLDWGVVSGTIEREREKGEREREKDHVRPLQSCDSLSNAVLYTQSSAADEGPAPTDV